jgi:hypothetical protein
LASLLLLLLLQNTTLCAALRLAHLGCPPAADAELLDIVHGGVQVHLVLGTRLPALVLRLQVLACTTAQCEAKVMSSKVSCKHAAASFGAARWHHEKVTPYLLEVTSN